MAEKTENMTKSCCQVRREEENDLLLRWFLITAADPPSVFISGKNKNKAPRRGEVTSLAQKRLLIRTGWL